MAKLLFRQWNVTEINTPHVNEFIKHFKNIGYEMIMIDNIKVIGKCCTCERPFLKGGKAISKSGEIVKIKTYEVKEFTEYLDHFDCPECHKLRMSTKRQEKQEKNKNKYTSRLNQTVKSKRFPPLFKRLAPEKLANFKGGFATYMFQKRMKRKQNNKGNSQ